MSATHTFFLTKAIKKIAVIMSVFISIGMTNSAFAVLIDFEDLTAVHDDVYPCWCDNPLENQYVSKGLQISGGAWLIGYPDNNVMVIGSGGAGLTFLGKLPTFVSMNVTSLNGDAIFLEAWGTSGHIETKRTPGWLGFEEGYIPAVPNELVTFNIAEGISSIFINGFYNLRVEADIDNLTFSHAAVPEPASILLLSLGLFGLALQRYGRQKGV